MNVGKTIPIRRGTGVFEVNLENNFCIFKTLIPAKTKSFTISKQKRPDKRQNEKKLVYQYLRSHKTFLVTVVIKIGR